MKLFIKKLLISALSLLFCVTVFSGFIMAEESPEEKEEGTITVETLYDAKTTESVAKWDIDYNDRWFNQSATVYNHKLARISLGMALSAFRPTLDPQGQINPAIHLQKFLSDCQFENLRSDDYDKEPSLYTVASVMGYKQLQDEQGDYILIAVGVCGGGYKNEWLSNMSCGDAEVHLGFYSAASAMYDRVFGYIARNQLSGHRFKIWVSGFSRAAAVSNVLAKLLVDSDIFDTDSVFAYTFATPRTTRNPQHGKYPNIFNICGKMDPVAQVTFADWGYDRFGTTLYTPAQQTDSDYKEKAFYANVIHKQAFGVNFFNNVEWDTRLRVILNYILKIIPNSSVYTVRMQDIAIRMLEDKSISNIMSCLMRIAEDTELINETNETEANRLLTYVAYTIYGYLTETDVEAKYRSEESTFKGNLAREHTPEVYLSWLFSTDDPERLYSDSMIYLRIIIDGDVDVAITLPENDELCKCLKSDGTFTGQINWFEKIIKKTNPDDPDVFMERTGGQHIILLPKDREYNILIKSNRDQKVDVHAIQLKVGYTNANLNKSHYAEMKKGDTDILFSSPSNDFEAEGYVSMVEGDTFDTVDIYHGTSSEVIFDLERANILDLNWCQIVILSFALPIVLLALVVFLVVMAAGKHNISVKKKRGILDEYATYNAKPAAAICAAVVLFLLQELLYWLMPGYMLQRALLKLLIGLILIYLCYVGYRRQPTTLSRHLIYGLTVCIIADIFINFSFEAGIITYALGEIFFIYAFTRYDRLERWQWIFWVLSSVFCIAVFHFSNLSAASEKQFSIYAVILMALVATALTMPKRIRHGAILLVISNVLLFRNEVMPKTLLSHVFALSIYYLAMGFFAFSSRYKELRALSLWKEDAPARQKLMSYMKSVTDRNSEDYIPIENRIAVFDLDGTLFCETDPNYFDYTLLVHRVLEDPDYIDKASDFEKEVANKIVTLNKTGVAASGLEVDHGKAIASAFAGMTIGEFNAYIQKFKQIPMPSYEGLKRGDGWYKPMLQLIEYLQENAFTVYVVSGTDRLIVRGIIYKSDLNVPARQIIGSDESIVTKKQGEADGLNYVFDDADELVLGGEFLVKNLKMNKVTVIAQEIGTQPVLSFGNSTGDSSMAEYVHNNNPYKSMAFMLCCDDTERENGNKEKADKMYALCKQFGWTPVSMKKDWVTIYGNNVKHKKK